MKLKHIALCTALGLASLAAHAASENVLRIGVGHINVRSQSPDFTATGPAFLTPQPAGITVGDATTLIIGYTRNITDNWSAEFIAGVPPVHSVKGRGTLEPYGEVSRIKQAAPTAFLTYNFGDKGQQWRPFVGLGVNFTHFFARNSTANGNLASGGPTKISLTNSVGLAWQTGVTVKLDKDWALCLSVAGAKVETDLNAATGSIERKTKIDLRPIVMTAGLNYAF